MKIISNGNLTRFGTTVLGLVGILVVLIALIYATAAWQFFGGIFVGVFLIAIASASSKAYVLGIKPFTNDPLGWRRAKKTYTDSGEHKRDEDKHT